jgi:hypothetical protein
VVLVTSVVLRATLVLTANRRIQRPSYPQLDFHRHWLPFRGLVDASDRPLLVPPAHRRCWDCRRHRPPFQLVGRALALTPVSLLMLRHRDFDTPEWLLYVSMVPSGLGMAITLTTTLLALIASVERDEIAVATGGATVVFSCSLLPQCNSIAVHLSLLSLPHDGPSSRCFSHICSLSACPRGQPPRPYYRPGCRRDHPPNPRIDKLHSYSPGGRQIRGSDGVGSLPQGCLRLPGREFISLDASLSSTSLYPFRKSLLTEDLS